MCFVRCMFTIPIFGLLGFFAPISFVFGDLYFLAFWPIAHLLCLASCPHQLGPAFNPAVRTFLELFRMNSFNPAVRTFLGFLE